MYPQVHWHEGLFLQPHHLQRMQKGVHDLMGRTRSLLWPYPYGVVESRLSSDELQNMRVRFDRLHVIMPSGMEVALPGNLELPTLDFKQAFAQSSGSLTILLGVPLWAGNRANTVPSGPGSDARAKLLYRIGEIECADENTGENPKPVQVRLINGRLLTENDDRSDLEVVPLVRIMRAAGAEVGSPRADPEFVPPCLVLNGSPTLRELVRDLAAQVEASRKALVLQISGGGFSVETMRGVQFEQAMRLRTLNRFSARLPSLIAAPTVTPFELYLEFRELLAELVALHPDRDEFECSSYDHENPFRVFRELSNKIRPYLRGVVKEAFIQVDFQEVAGVLTAALTPEHFSVPNAYFLGVHSKQDPIALARYVEDGDKFKLMPQSLSRSAVRGVELKWERHPPLGLPAHSDLHYFRLDRAASARRWEQIQGEQKAVIVWTAAAQSEVDWSGARFSLYMTVPQPG